MANAWLRLWHDMPNDPKWRTIARVSGQPIATVMAVYIHLLVSASRNVTRGHADVTTEDLASALDVTEEAIDLILQAMQGRTLDGDLITGWEKRQVLKEDNGNISLTAKSPTERKRAQREREKQQRESGYCHAASRNVTHMSRRVTTDTDTDTDTDLKTDPGSSQKIPMNQQEADRPGLKADPAEQREADSDCVTGYPVEFEQVWREYPHRSGANPKKSAFSAWKARMREGATPEDMLSGVRRYTRYLQATGKLGTEFVQRAATFFGPDRNFENPWHPPAGRNSVGVNWVSDPDTEIPPGFRG
ncbi:phage replisome organizer [Salmonella enterica]|nr:phage replisome organizer [Salmonella enterica]